MEDLQRDGAICGVIALDESGSCGSFPSSFRDNRDTVFTDAMTLNCEGMYRGVIKEDGDAKVAIFHDDILA